MKATVTIAMPVALLTILLVRNIRRRKGSVIVAPRLGMLNLKGADGTLLAEQDARALLPVLEPAAQSNLGVSKCDVLFLYSDLSSYGRIATTKIGMG